jgi:predicted lipoprotein with Yx(FWY)xxD motif
MDTTQLNRGEHLTPTTRRARAIRAGGALSAVAAGLLLLTACGSGGSTAAATSPGPSPGTTVTVHDAGGMHVLATSSGRTLYVSDQEHGKVLCTSGACHAIWAPLTVKAGQQPTAAGGVAGDLTTVRLSDGTRQVAFDGQPLYTFSFDHGAGQANGDGQSDSFDGAHFTWHAATPTGPGSTPTSGSSSGSSHGYGY